MREYTGDNVAIKKIGNVGVLECSGSLDNNTYLRLKNAINLQFKRKIYKIVLDMSKVTFVSSAGWGTIIGNLNEARGGCGEIAVAAMPGNISHGFLEAEFNEIIRSYKTIRDAIQSFEKMQ